MLGTGIVSKLQSVYTALAAIVSSLSRFKLAHHVMVVVGLVSEIVLSVLESAATMNPATWILKTGIVFFDVNGRLISNVATLQSGVPTWRAFQITIAIWSHLFVLYLGIKFFTMLAEQSFAGDNAPKIPAYLFIALIVLAPVQMVAGLLSMGVQGEKLVMTKEVIPYSGVYEVITHAGLWIEPTKQILFNIPGVESVLTSGGGNSSKAVEVIS